MCLFGWKGEKKKEDKKLEKGVDKWEDRRNVVFSCIYLIEMIEKWIQNRW